MGLFDALRPATAGLSPTVRAGLAAADTGRVLTWARDTNTGDVVAATTGCVVSVGDDGRVHWARPWSEVLSGSWEPVTETISVTWVDGSRAAQWTFARGGSRFSDVFHDRVAASVLIDAPVVVDGRDMGRVALRRDLMTGELRSQRVRSRGVRADDPEYARAAAAVLDDLTERAGLDVAASADVTTPPGGRGAPAAKDGVAATD